jgi:hypothetical protein
MEAKSSTVEEGRAQAPSRARRRPHPAGKRINQPAPARARSRRSAAAFHKPVPWPDIIPAGQWANYRLAIETARAEGIRFLLGGGFSLAIYTGRWRNTKDIDFYILPRDRDPMIAALSKAGFVDYFDQLPYDPGWIYRSTREGIIVDIIWSMANRRAEVDELWFERAQSTRIREEATEIVPPEELLWCKLYILQRDHSDWTDIFNLLYTVGPLLDWEHLFRRVGPDLPLLRSAVGVFLWLCPNRARALPDRVFEMLGLERPARVSSTEQQHRVRLLDSRGWFGAFQPADQTLEV